MCEIDDVIELPRTLFKGEPTMRLDQVMKARCLKCGYACNVTEFSFVCTFCRSSNFSLQALSVQPAFAVVSKEGIYAAA